MVYSAFSSEGGALGETRAKRASQRTRTVSEDWLAWIPAEKRELFDATRKELETSNFILCMTIDEALQLCKDERWDIANDTVVVFAGLFDRLAARVLHVIRTIREHGSHFGTVPNVDPLSSANFRGSSAQKIARTSSLLAKVVFGQRSRFFHKLYSIDEIVVGLQGEMRALVTDVSAEDSECRDQTWNLLEVLSYDMATCMGETTILLKSFFCALPIEEVAAFREKLVTNDPALFGFDPGRTQPA
jgi:hypothetical protein